MKIKDCVFEMSLVLVPNRRASSALVLRGYLKGGEKHSKDFGAEQVGGLCLSSKSTWSGPAGLVVASEADSKKKLLVS